VPLPDDVDARELDPAARQQLRSLAKETADLVARHLVMAGRLMDEDPPQALAHARAARALAGRVGAVREANGLVAYVAGEWTEALSELRTARRLTGEPDHLAVMADCERALGRPDRALVTTADPQAERLDPAAKVELLIVASGARRDLGQVDAAVASLEVAALQGPVRPWTARLRYAYADALLDAGREGDARQWFARAAEVDEDGQTDAEERLLELDGLVLIDLDEDETDEDDAPDVDIATGGAPDGSDSFAHARSTDNEG
jgi:tetratricopeptide (TPR) repeat protein